MIASSLLFLSSGAVGYGAIVAAMAGMTYRLERKEHLARLGVKVSICLMTLALAVAGVGGYFIGG